jgi:hypothetical protein
MLPARSARPGPQTYRPRARASRVNPRPGHGVSARPNTLDCGRLGGPFSARCTSDPSNANASSHSRPQHRQAVPARYPIAPPKPARCATRRAGRTMRRCNDQTSRTHPGSILDVVADGASDDRRGPERARLACGFFQVKPFNRYKYSASFPRKFSARPKFLPSCRNPAHVKISEHSPDIAVHRITGRPPLSFAACLRRHRRLWSRKALLSRVCGR